MKIGFLTFDWTDLLDILLVALLLYQIYRLVRGSLASRVFLGYLFVYVFYLIVRGLRLELLTAILEYFMGVGALALIIIFQQEIRRFLLLIGKSASLPNNRLFKGFWGGSYRRDDEETIRVVAEAAHAIATSFQGALLVVGDSDPLDKYAETGVRLDAVLSKALLVTLCNQYGNLHEGGIIISEGRLKAARCTLPMAEGADVPSNLGFRHKAALGVSEVTDALVLAISEQTGKISVALDGQLHPNVSLEELKAHLRSHIGSAA